MSDIQNRDTDWFTEWEGIEEQETKPTVEGQDQAEKRLWVVKMLRSEIHEIQQHAANERGKIDLWERNQTEKVQKQLAWLESGLRVFLDTTNKATLKLVNGTLKYRKGRERIEIADEEAFVKAAEMDDKGFVRTTVKKAPDKKAILEYINETGEIPEGVDIVTGEGSFTIEV